jgi:hypothetical protein
MTDWIAQMHADADFAKALLISNGEVKPMFIIHCPEHVKVVGAAWKNTEEKRITQKLISMQAALDDAEAISFISEAWCREVRRYDGESKADHTKRINAVAPSEAEDRIEIIMIAVNYRERNRTRTAGMSLEIIRDKDGVPTDAINRDGEAQAMLQGPMINLLLPKKLTEAQKIIVKHALNTLKEIAGYEEIPDAVIHPAGHA